MTNLSFSSCWHWEQLWKKWFKVVCGNDNITHLKVKPHFGIGTGASDFVGRKYWLLIFFFWNINMVDDSNNKHKRYSKPSSAATQEHLHTCSWYTVSRSPWSYTFSVGSELLFPWPMKLYSKQWVWEAEWKENQRETPAQEDHRVMTSAIVIWW